jgi:hypothetical protein
MRMITLVLSRQWLPAIAVDYGARLGISNNMLNETAAEDATSLLAIAPWHFRLLVGPVEMLASLWCWLYRFRQDGPINMLQEIAAFEKIPLIGVPLLRLYRSLIAISWFEDPEVLTSYGIPESAEARQEIFRQKRDEAA